MDSNAHWQHEEFIKSVAAIGDNLREPEQPAEGQSWEAFRSEVLAVRKQKGTYWNLDEINNRGEVREQAERAGLLSACGNFILRPHFAESERGFWREVQRLGLENFRVVIGAAGTGKTYTLAKTVLDAASMRSLDILIATMAGIASERAREAIARAFADAKQMTSKKAHTGTIHHIFDIPVPTDPSKSKHSNTKGYKKTTTVIFDELSMVDSATAHRALEVIKRGTLIYLFGDTGQLQPVGPGQPFFHLLETLKARYPENVTELTKNYRTGSEGLLSATLAIREGRVPQLEGPGWSVKVCDPKKMLDRAIFDAVAKKAQILSPYRLFAFRAGWHIAAKENPRMNREAPDPKTGLPRAYCPGDILVSTRNNHRIGMANGRKVKYVRRTPNGDHVVVELDSYGMQGKRIQIPPGAESQHLAQTGEIEASDLMDKEVLVFSQALTISRSQGHEFDNVSVFVPSAGPFIDRNMLYTACTRAKKHCTLYVPSLDILPTLVERQKPTPPTVPHE